MESNVDDLEPSTEEQPSNFLVLASQSETQYSEWDQQHLLQSLPALKTQMASDNTQKQGARDNPFLGKSDDERQSVPGSVLVEETTEYEVSPHEHDDGDRIENSYSEDDSDSAANVTVVKKTSTSNEDQSNSPVYKSQDEGASVRYGARDGSNVRNLFPATLSQEDVFQGQLSQEQEGDHIVATPSEHIGSLRLSGEPMRVPETVEESLDVLAPSPGAYGDIPVIIPSSPTASEGEADTSTFNPDANRTLEADDIKVKGRQKKDRRERLPHPSNEDKPITIGETVPENVEDEVMFLNPNAKTLACEETQGESLHLVYSETEAADRSNSGAKELERKEGSGEKQDEAEVIEDSQDLALHLSQSQGDFINPPGTAHSSRRSKSSSVSQPETTGGKGKRDGRSKSVSVSTDSNGFHLSVPKDGALIHPVKGPSTSDDPKDASLQEPRPAVPSVPSLSISHLESQSQSASDTSFRIEKPDLHMTEEGDEATGEMNVFQKTRAGRPRPAHMQLNLSEESSEDYFNIKRTRGKQKTASGEVTPREENPAEPDGSTHIDQDAETQQDENQAVHLNVSMEKAALQAEEPHPFDENTETYEVPKSLDIELVEESGKADKNTNSSCAGTSTTTLPVGKSRKTVPYKRDKDVGENVEPEEDGNQAKSDSVQTHEVVDSRSKVSDVTSGRSDPAPSTSKGLTKSPKGREKNVVSKPEPAPSEDVTGLEAKSKGSVSGKEPKVTKKTVPGLVDSTSGTRRGKARSRNISLTKDSGIGDQLDLTSRSETSPRHGQSTAALERIPSDPYQFHGTQSQPPEQNIKQKPPTTTPLSSRKKQKGTLKKVSSKKDASSSSDMKEPVAKPRPKKLIFTKIQRSSRRRNSTTVVTSTVTANSEAVPGPSRVAVVKQGSVSVPSSPGTGFEADISRSVSTQNTLQRHVAFQQTREKTPSPPLQEPGQLSDSQLSDQLVKTVKVTVKRKTVDITTTITTVVNREGKIVEHQKQEEHEESPLTTIYVSEKTTELPLVSPSRTASSLTPGDLADISSGYSRSTSSGKGSLEKSSGSLSLVSPSIHRKDESFTALLTSSSIQPSLAHGVTSHVMSPQVRVDNPPVMSSRRETRTPVSDITNGGHVNTPDESVIEKTDSRIGAVVSSSGGQRTSESLFTSPDMNKGDKQASPGDNVEHPTDRSGNKQSSPALRKRAADSSQDVSSDITSAQRPRMSESGGFSVHGSAYSQQKQRLDAPLNVLVMSDSDIPPSQNRRTTRAEDRNVTTKTSSDEGHLSPEIPLQTNTTEISETADVQCPVVHASTPEIGSTVMAKWKDGFFYPGRIVKLDQTGRFYIRFDDGDQMYVKIENILLVNQIPIGQSVMVMSPDGYFDCGMIVGYIQETTNVMYKVSKDEGGTQKYSRSQIILSEDQASCLMSDEEMRVPAAVTAGTSTTKLGDVSLDNLVVGERRSRHRTEEEKPDKKEENEESPKKSRESSRSTRKGRSASRSEHKEEDKPKELSSRGKKRKAPEGPMATSTPTPKAKRPAESTVSVTPSTSGMGGAVDSPSESRRQGRKARVGLFEKEKQNTRSKSSRMFYGMVFLLTHVDKSEEQKQQEKKLLQDSSLETSTEESGIEEEPSVPFNKENLTANIEAAGGVVLEKFNQAQVDAATKAFLISSSFQRTVKYFQCLAAGIPCVSHQWIIHSCSEGRLLDHKAYILPAGISLERRKLMEWNPCGSCLSGMVMMVVSPNIKFQDAWQSILTISRCRLVNRLPIRNKTDEAVDVVVSDGSCPLSIQHQAQKISVPIVTTEWVIQCLINGHSVGYDAHPQYKHDFQK